jgi:flagellar hook-basal body complex protein FliE
MSGINFAAYSALGGVKPAEQVKSPVKPEADGNVVSEGFSAFKQSMEAAEQTAMQTAVSGADPHAMVEALANAELVLDAAVTIRDKVVEAYQELLRMPV